MWNVINSEPSTLTFRRQYIFNAYTFHHQQWKACVYDGRWTAGWSIMIGSYKINSMNHAFSLPLLITHNIHHSDIRCASQTAHLARSNQPYSTRMWVDAQCAHMANYRRFFASCISSEPRAAHFRPQHDTTQPFYGPFSGRPGWASARRELLDFMVQGEIKRGRHTEHLAGRRSIRTNQCPHPPSPPFLQVGCPSCCPTNSVKALKATSAFGLERRR